MNPKGTHTRYVVLVADVLVEQAVADLPGKDGRALALVVGDAHHLFFVWFCLEFILVEYNCILWMSLVWTLTLKLTWL